MEYYVYILHSLSIQKYYIGITANLDKRLEEHNAGVSYKAWTRRANDWIIVYKEQFESKKLALKREKEIKGYKGGNSFKNLITSR